MAIKKFCQVGLLSIGLLATGTLIAQDNPLGQTFQINTRLNSYVGKPTWLIIVTDLETGQVMPYLFDITSTENFWFEFTFAHTYRITVSDLQFGPPDKIIHNFCHLQYGTLRNQSIVVNLSGDLTPDRGTSECHVMRYKEYTFPIAQQTTEETTSTTTTTTQKVSAAISHPVAAFSSMAKSIGQK